MADSFIGSEAEETAGWVQIVYNFPFERVCSSTLEIEVFVNVLEKFSMRTSAHNPGMLLRQNNQLFSVIWTALIDN